MKRFLFLYPDAPTRRALAKSQAWLDERDIRIVYADEEPQTDEELILPNYVDVAGAVKTVEQYARSHKLDGLIVQTEYGLLPGAILGERLGLLGPTILSATYSTNKLWSRQYMKWNGIRTPRFALGETADDVRRFDSMPCVLKGVASTMGRNVIIVSTPDEVDDRVADLLARLPDAPDVIRLRNFSSMLERGHPMADLRCNPTRQFLIEEYVPGTPLEIDGLNLCTKGRETIDWFGVIEQIPSTGPYYFIEGYLGPTDQNPYDLLNEAMAASELAQRSGGFSIEFRGQTVIEINGRLGEDDGFPDFFKAIRGEYPILDSIAGMAGIKFDGRPPTGHAALAYLNSYVDGTVRAVPEPREGVEFCVKRGQRMYAPPHPEVAPHLAYALRTHPTSSRAAYEEARRALEGLEFVIE